MKSLKPVELEYWNNYLLTLNVSERPVNPAINASFAGSAAITDALLALYFEGKKTAGSSILEDFLSCGDPVPKVGDYWIYLDSTGAPKCILRTERVVLNKFFDVPVAIAIAEGEGDLSLEYWRKAHAEFYEPHLEAWGLKDISEATVITEYFEIVYR